MQIGTRVPIGGGGPYPKFSQKNFLKRAPGSYPKSVLPWQNLAFVRVEFHFIFMFPGLEYIKVPLQDDRFLRCEDIPVEEAVLNEKSDLCTWGEVLFICVINVGQE